MSVARDVREDVETEPESPRETCFVLGEPEEVRERVGVIREANGAVQDRPDRERRIVRHVAISGDAGEYGSQLCDHLEHEGLHLIHVGAYEGPPQTVDVLVYV